MTKTLQLRLSQLRPWLLALPRWQKRLLLVFNDLILLAVALWISVSVQRGSMLLPSEWSGGWTFIAAPILGAFAYHYFGSYKQVTRFFSQFGSYRILMGTFFAILALAAGVYASGTREFPLSILVMFGLLSGYLIVSSRNIASGLLSRSEFYSDEMDKASETNVLIYGSGNAGNQLSHALAGNSNYRNVGFIDDNKELWRQRIDGLKVYPPHQLADVIKRESVKEIFLAIPSLKRSSARKIFNSLKHYKVAVKTLPALEDLASGRIQFSDLRPIDVEDLLGRDPVKAQEELLSHSVTGRSVLVTGAGGSIGAELVRQIYELGPQILVLLDQSEAALYEISSEISEKAERDSGASEIRRNPDVHSVLGSVLDQKLIERILKEYGVQTIYHAAAYKHVPIVEDNQVTGIINNTFGTKVIAESACRNGIEKLILISSDKAVRPTNVMGASKRLAELILQAMANKKGDEDRNFGKTTFAMVRFGNVLDSSGSVVPKFRKQISEGGPVTITHRDMERYFMSIAEAVQLVIQAATLAENGGVYVLDMGEPVKISLLARTMIELSGLQVIDDENPDGDIAIEYSGLRPGEKIKEELLISDNAVGTAHPRILKNIEPFLPYKDLKSELSQLSRACADHNLIEIERLLEKNVEGYRKYSNRFDDSENDVEDRVVNFPVQNLR